MVLMLTAAGAPGDGVSGLGLAADDYLAKPFHFAELALRIRTLGRRRSAAGPGRCAPPTSRDAVAEVTWQRTRLPVVLDARRPGQPYLSVTVGRF